MNLASNQLQSGDTFSKSDSNDDNYRFEPQLTLPGSNESLRAASSVNDLWESEVEKIVVLSNN